MGHKTSNTPTAFLCHSSKDKPLVTRLADDLRQNGIDAWLDKYEIRPGDSLRRKVFEEGIKNAQFFMVVLTPNSLESNWVQEELDAAFVKKIAGECTLLPIVTELDDGEIPTSLRGIHWVRMEDYDKGLRDLV